ncbi:MAG: AraC family transcriptional regulator [Myxococcales bacterium]|nr:AraC family transcriptional regulator [Myxococcales bacterium]
MGRALPEAPPARGVLRGAPPLADAQEHRRVLPPPALADFVAHFWTVRWRLDAPTSAETLPHPCVHLVVEVDGEGARAQVAGIHRGRFTRRLEGEGWVFGIKFRPAMFQPLVGGSLDRLGDLALPIAALFGDDGEAWAREVLAAADLEARIAASVALLAPRLPPPPAASLRLRDLVERAAIDRSLVRVDELAEAAGLDARALQRAFRRHVGVTPKWVLSRYRLHEAAEQLQSAAPPPLAELAAALGYADQAHFARDFKRVVGRSPGAFAAGSRGE